MQARTRCFAACCRQSHSGRWQIGDAVAEGTPLQIVCRPAFFGSVSAQVVDLVGGGLDAENVSYLAGKPGRDFTRGVKAFPRNRIRSVLE